MGIFGLLSILIFGIPFLLYGRAAFRVLTVIFSGLFVGGVFAAISSASSTEDGSGVFIFFFFGFILGAVVVGALRPLGNIIGGFGFGYATVSAFAILVSSERFFRFSTSARFGGDLDFFFEEATELAPYMLMGALVFAVLAAVKEAPTIIFLTSASGASSVMSGLAVMEPFGRSVYALAFLGLTAFGCWFQYQRNKYDVNTAMGWETTSGASAPVAYGNTDPASASFNDNTGRRPQASNNAQGNMPNFGSYGNQSASAQNTPSASPSAGAVPPPPQYMSTPPAQSTPASTPAQPTSSASTSATDGKSVLLVTRDADDELASNLADRLKSSFGSATFNLGTPSIVPPGEDYVDEMGNLVSDVDMMLIIITNEWNSDNWLSDDEDIDSLAISEGLSQKTRMIPLLVDGATLPEDLPASVKKLSRKSPLELNQDSFDDDYANLKSSLERLFSR